MQKSDTPGLKIRIRKNGERSLLWAAPPKAVKAGFTPKTLHLPADYPTPAIANMCRHFWGQAMDFLECRHREPFYDGTLASVIRIYLTHTASPFRELKSGPSRVYTIYCKKLAQRYAQARPLDRPRYPALVCGVAGGRRWRGPSRRYIDDGEYFAGCPVVWAALRAQGLRRAAGHAAGAEIAVAKAAQRGADGRRGRPGDGGCQGPRAALGSALLRAAVRNSDSAV
jgi:hypothetical protein